MDESGFQPITILAASLGPAKLDCYAESVAPWTFKTGTWSVPPWTLAPTQTRSTPPAPTPGFLLPLFFYCSGLVKRDPSIHSIHGMTGSGRRRAGGARRAAGGVRGDRTAPRRARAAVILAWTTSVREQEEYSLNGVLPDPRQDKTGQRSRGQRFSGITSNNSLTMTRSRLVRTSRVSYKVIGIGAPCNVTNL